MIVLYPIILSTSINLGIYSSVSIKMMVDTMDDEALWGTDDKEKTSKALLCMLGLGVGEIAGSIAFGRVMDKCPIKCTVLINILAATIGYGSLLLFGAFYEFSFPLAILMTTSWGVQDAGIVCLLQSMLGFQFESQTTPFSVYKFMQSLLIFVVFYIESLIETQTAYLVYFCICYALAILAWVVFYNFFDVMSKEDVQRMRFASSSIVTT